MVVFDNNNHSVFSLNYHLIMVVKYRKKVINDEISNRLKEIFDEVEIFSQDIYYYPDISTGGAISCDDKISNNTKIIDK